MNLLFQKFIQKLNENIIDVYISLNKKLIKIITNKIHTHTRYKN